MKATSNPKAGQRSKAITPLDDIRRLALAKRRIYIAITTARAALVRDGDIDEGADKGDIQHHGEERGEGEAGDAAQQQQGGQGVQDGDAGDALDGADAGRNGQLVVGEAGEEVRVDAEDEGRAGELDAPDEPLSGLEAEAGSGGHDE